jgi:trimethylamine--corrinoid protein Co-methyltransferase
MESGISAVLGALGGINMISGAGMLDFLACQSAEKLVVDAEAIGMARRLLGGMQVRTTTLALEMFAGIDFKPDFLKQRLTRQLFSAEQYLPSSVIDRGSARAWQDAGRPDTMTRARTRTEEILKGYQRPRASDEQEAELRDVVAGLARQAGMDTLPPLSDE